MLCPFCSICCWKSGNLVVKSITSAVRNKQWVVWRRTLQCSTVMTRALEKFINGTIQRLTKLVTAFLIANSLFYICCAFWNTGNKYALQKLAQFELLHILLGELIQTFFYVCILHLLCWSWIMIALYMVLLKVVFYMCLSMSWWWSIHLCSEIRAHFKLFEAKTALKINYVFKCTLCLKKMHQLWNGMAQNCRDRFWWFLAEIFKSL